MRKILLAIDAQHLSNKTIDFACYVAALTKSKLTGIFLENLLIEEMSELAQASSYNNDIPLSYERNKITDENIRSFREACEKRGVNTNIHRKRGAPAQEMIEESRFADLIITNAETSFKKKMENTPSEFVKEILEKAECPVIIAPESFDGIDEIIFTYNKSRSSVLAIKQFVYLFPEFQNKKITLLEVNKENEIGVRAKPRISEWLKTYYDEVDFKLLTGDCEEELFKYLLNKKNLFLVMGAYGRNAFSSLIKPSRARLIVKTTDFPIFIAHH